MICRVCLPRMVVERGIEGTYIAIISITNQLYISTCRALAGKPYIKSPSSDLLHVVVASPCLDSVVELVVQNPVKSPIHQPAFHLNVQTLYLPHVIVRALLPCVVEVHNLTRGLVR